MMCVNMRKTTCVRAADMGFKNVSQCVLVSLISFLWLDLFIRCPARVGCEAFLN